MRVNLLNSVTIFVAVVFLMLGVFVQSSFGEVRILNQVVADDNVVAGSESGVFNLHFSSEQENVSMVWFESENYQAIQSLTFVYPDVNENIIEITNEFAEHDGIGVASFNLNNNPIVLGNGVIEVSVSVLLEQISERVPDGIEVQVNFAGYFVDEQMQQHEIEGPLMRVMKSVPTIEKVQVNNALINGSTILYSSRLHSSEGGLCGYSQIPFMVILSDFSGQGQPLTLRRFYLVVDGDWILTPGEDFRIVTDEGDEISDDGSIVYNEDEPSQLCFIEFLREFIVEPEHSPTLDICAVISGAGAGPNGQDIVSVFIRNRDEEPVSGYLNDLEGSYFIFYTFSGQNGDGNHGEESNDYHNGWMLRSIGSTYATTIVYGQGGGGGDDEERGYLEIEETSPYQYYLNPGHTQEVIEFTTNSNVQYQFSEATLEFHRIWGAPDVDVNDEDIRNVSSMRLLLCTYGYIGVTGFHDSDEFNNCDDGGENGVWLQLDGLENYQCQPDTTYNWVVMAYFSEDIRLDGYQFNLKFGDESFRDEDNESWIEDFRPENNLTGPILDFVENEIRLQADYFTAELNPVELYYQSGVPTRGLQFVVESPAPLVRVESNIDNYMARTEALGDNQYGVVLASVGDEVIPADYIQLMTLFFDGAELEPQDEVFIEVIDWLVASQYEGHVNFSFEGTSTIRGEINDPNVDGMITVADIVYVDNFIHRNWWFPGYQLWAIDNDGSGEINIRDLLRMIDAIFEDMQQGAGFIEGPFWENSGINRDDSDFEWTHETNQWIRGFQVDLYGELAEHEVFLNPERCNGMALTQSWHDSLGCRRVVVYGLGDGIEPSEGSLIIIPDFNGEVEVRESIVVYTDEANDVGTDNTVPETFCLNSAYPNPFNSSATISFSLPSTEQVNLTIYDLSGREIQKLVNNTLNAGVHTVNFDGKDLATGVYLVQLQAGNNIASQKLTLVK